jgi:hypothetical protein
MTLKIICNRQFILERHLVNSEIMNAANMRLATLFGWTNLFALGGALLGTPPAGAPSCRGQALVPDWCRDWRPTGPLIGAYGIELQWVNGDTAVTALASTSQMHEGFTEQLADHANLDDAVRLAIVRAVTAMLERRP